MESSEEDERKPKKGRRNMNPDEELDIKPDVSTMKLEPKNKPERARLTSTEDFNEPSADPNTKG